MAFNINKTAWSLGYLILFSVAELEDLSLAGGLSHPLECSVCGCFCLPGLQLECKSWDRLKHTQLCDWCICQCAGWHIGLGIGVQNYGVENGSED